MPARTGQQYLDGLREQEREVWLGGERVRDVTTHPASPAARARSRGSTTCSTTPHCAT